MGRKPPDYGVLLEKFRPGGDRRPKPATRRKPPGTRYVIPSEIRLPPLAELLRIDAEAERQTREQRDYPA